MYPLLLGYRHRFENALESNEAHIGKESCRVIAIPPDILHIGVNQPGAWRNSILTLLYWCCYPRGPTAKYHARTRIADFSSREGDPMPRQNRIRRKLKCIKGVDEAYGRCNVPLLR
ncbi:hypothetical protein WG66_014497 [Moniliophthora roreri]|nr:hypothetical protein WG66_014497 [Moniliophthora roreri]